MPVREEEPLLVTFADSVERLIRTAYRCIRDRRINEFDQVRINSFLQQQRVWDRPILIELKPSTYRRYVQVWQRLICFTYLSTRPGQPRGPGTPADARAAQRAG